MEIKKIKGTCPDCKKELIGEEETQTVMEEWEDGTRKYYRQGFAGAECSCGYAEGGPIREYLGTEEEYMAEDDCCGCTHEFCATCENIEHQ